MITAQQCRMARAALQIGIRDVAKMASVSTNTIIRLEAGEALLPRTVEAIRTALEQAGVRFVEAGDTADGPGVVLADRA